MDKIKKTEFDGKTYHDTSCPWAALLGCPETKRKLYLERAARDEGLHVLFIDWAEWKEDAWEEWLAVHGRRGILKIDPPRWDSAAIEEFPALIGEYQYSLFRIEQMANALGIRFFNRPGDICKLLDKRKCKARLVQAGLPVTEEAFAVAASEKQEAFALKITEMEELLEAMRERRTDRVFIKPNCGSGALGVSAFRIQRRTGRMVLYTCAVLDPKSHGLVNTRRLQRLEDPGEIAAFLNQLLKLDCIIERWYAKMEYQGFTCDLRAVIQDGRMDMLLARLSRGPITNLQLNNHPLLAEELNLPVSVLAEVEALCREAVGLYQGIRSAGIDILLEKSGLRPRIIEMNGQGDLIYQDIYHENRIYRHQAQMMQKEILNMQEKHG